MSDERLRELLASDPGARECFETVVLRSRPMTVDGIIACFGDDQDLAAGDSVVSPVISTPPSEGFTADEQRLYEQSSAAMFGAAEDVGCDGVPDLAAREMSETEAALDGYPEGSSGVWVPDHLVASIDDTYSVVRRHGFATQRDFEEQLHEWLSGVLG